MKPPPPEFHYSESYDEMNYGRSLAGAVMTRGHVELERGHGPAELFPRVIEVGAETGQHVRHVRHRFDSYVLTDSSAAVLEIARRNTPSAVRDRVRFEVQDATRLTYPDASFDRLIACHVLEHLRDPVAALREWSRVVRADGVLSFLLPCDPGLAWRIGRCLGPRHAARARGIEYDYVLATEHVNSIFSLTTFLRYHFDVIEECWFPFRIPYADVNLFYAGDVRNTPSEG